MPTSAHAECTVFTEILCKFVTSQWADVGIGPYRTPAKSYYLARFKRSDSQIWCPVTGGAYHSVREVSLCVRNDRKLELT